MCDTNWCLSWSIGERQSPCSSLMTHAVNVVVAQTSLSAAGQSPSSTRMQSSAQRKIISISTHHEYDLNTQHNTWAHMPPHKDRLQTKGDLD